MQKFGFDKFGKLDLSPFLDRIPPEVSDFSVQIFENEAHFDELLKRMVFIQDEDEAKEGEDVEKDDLVAWTERAKVAQHIPGSANGTLTVRFNRKVSHKARLVAACCNDRKSITLTVRLADGAKTPKPACKLNFPGDVNWRRRITADDDFPIHAWQTARTFWDLLNYSDSGRSVLCEKRHKVLWS